MSLSHLRRARWIFAMMLAAVATAINQTSSAADDEAKFEIYGFAMGDYIQDFKRVNPAWEDTLRPSRIPTSNGEFGTDGQASISVKQSRLGANAEVPLSVNKLKTKLEFDFFGVGVDEGQATIRLRHAYGQWGQWLGGQTHSLFMDIDVFPNVIDYWGPAGMAFLRLPQLRWMPIQGDTSLSIAIEKPSGDIDAGRVREIDPDLGSNIRPDEKTPDLTAQVRHQGDFGHVQLGGIVRRLGYETLTTAGNSPKGFKVGWGFDLSTQLRIFTRDKIYASVLMGQGIASYMNDGGMDLAPEGAPGNLRPKAVPLYGITAYYEHGWSERWVSSIGYSRTQVENTTFQSGSAFHSGDYASVNLLYSPVKSVLFGAELLWGRRTDNNFSKGEDVRSQISFKYNFSSLAKAENP